MHDGSLKGLVCSTVCVRYSFVEGMGLVCPKRRFGLPGEGFLGPLTQV